MYKNIRDIPEFKQCEVIWQGYEDKVAEKVTRFFVAGFNPSR